MLSAWRDAKDLIEIDAYVPGTNPVVDRAIAFKPPLTPTPARRCWNARRWNRLVLVCSPSPDRGPSREELLVPARNGAPRPSRRNAPGTQSVGVAARVLASALVREQEMVDIYEQAARPRGELDGAAFVAAHERGGRLAACWHRLWTSARPTRHASVRSASRLCGQNVVSRCSRGSTSVAGRMDGCCPARRRRSARRLRYGPRCGESNGGDPC